MYVTWICAVVVDVVVAVVVLVIVMRLHILVWLQVLLVYYALIWFSVLEVLFCFLNMFLFYLMCYSVCKVCFKCVFCSKCMFCFGCIWCVDRKCYSVCMLCLTAYHVSLHVIFLKVCTDLCISSALSHFPFNIPALRNSYMFTLYTTMIITLKRKHVINIKKHVINKRHAINKQCTYFSYVIH